MNKKRKVTKRIAAWFMCLAMVLTTTNLPAFSVDVKAAETVTSSITIDGNEYALYTGFTATAGIENPKGESTHHSNMVDGDISTKWTDVQSDEALSLGYTYLEFSSDVPIILKGYILNSYHDKSFHPSEWRLFAKADETDEYEEVSSYTNMTYSGKENTYPVVNEENNQYRYFRFEGTNSTQNVWLNEIRLYGKNELTYGFIPKKNATCTETGIKQDCYIRSDRKYFTDQTGTTELSEANVIAPIVPHTIEDETAHVSTCTVCGQTFVTGPHIFLDENGETLDCICGEINPDHNHGYCGDPEVNDGKDVTWRVTQEEDGNYTLTISGTGRMVDFYSNTSIPWNKAKQRNYWDKITKAVVSDGVTYVGIWAFYGLSGLKEATIPSSVTAFGNNLFWQCTALDKVEIPCSLEYASKWSVDESAVVKYHVYEEQPFIDRGDGTHYQNCKCGNESTTPENHNFSVSVNETTHKCADCDATENHVFANDTDTTCDVCGYVRTVTEEDHTSDEIIYEVDINGIHHLKYDENTETYICKDKGCEKAFEPGYYDNYGLVEDTIDTVYALLGNITETDDIDFSDYESLEIVDLGSLTSYDNDFGFVSLPNLTYLNLGSLTSYDNDFNFGSITTPNLTYIDLGSLTSYYNDFIFYLLPNLTYVDLGSLTSYDCDLDFTKCTKLTNVILGNLMNCGYLSFCDCSGLINVDLGSLQNINHIEFINCKSLQTVNLQNLIDLGGINISGCELLESVKVHEGDPCYIGQCVEEDVISYAPHTFIIDSENPSQHICSVCDAAGDHDFDEDTVFTKVDENTHQWTCSSCGGVASGNHDFSQNGTCACGLIQIEFEIIDDEKTVRVTGLNKDFDMTHDLFIPSTVEVNGEDYSVTEIDVQAFWECNITGEVVIPDSVITIGDYAFSGCGNIERISIPCTIDPYEIYWGIDSEKIVQRSHDFSNGALKCNLCGKCKALSETGRHDFNDEFKCTNCGQVDQFGVYFSQYKDLVIVENDDNKPWAWDMDKQSLVPDNVDSYAYSSMTITAKKRVKISFSYSFDKAPHGEDMLVIKRTTKEGDYEENERYPSNYNGEYPYDDDNRDPLILYPGEALQIDYRFGSEYEDEGIRLGEFKINEITYVEIKGMSLELDPVYGAYIGVNLYIDASDNASLYFDDMPVTPDGEEVKLVIDDNTGIKKIQYRCAVKEFADIHNLVACDGDGNTIALSLDLYTDVEEFTYSGMSYCDAVLAGGTVYSDELKALCSALCEFNEQARNYFEYNNDGLNIGSVTADIPTTGYESSMTGKLPEGCSYLGSSLILKDEIVLRHYFSGDISTGYKKCYNKAKDIYVASNAVKMSDDICYIDIAAPYSNIGDMYELILGEGDEAYKLTYGVLTYCNKAYELNPNSELVSICNAMYNYSVAANAYFAAN